jgi:hypothetical protein
VPDRAKLVRFRQERLSEYRIQTQIKKMPGRDDQGFVDINATALNAAISG